MAGPLRFLRFRARPRSVRFSWTEEVTWGKRGARPYCAGLLEVVTLVVTVDLASPVIDVLAVLGEGSVTKHWGATSSWKTLCTVPFGTWFTLGTEMRVMDDRDYQSNPSPARRSLSSEHSGEGAGRFCVPSVRRRARILAVG